MFGFARVIVRNKMVFIGLAVVLVLLFRSNHDADQDKPKSPWASGPVAAAPAVTSSGSKVSLTDKVLKAADSAADYAGVGEYKPSALRNQAVGNLNQTEGSFKKVNHSE